MSTKHEQAQAAVVRHFGRRNTDKLTPDELKVLVDDVVDLWQDEKVADAATATRILSRRIGGTPNLRSYVASLMAGRH